MRNINNMKGGTIMKRAYNIVVKSMERGNDMKKIGKESSKSGAQNQGLVSNLQAPDFVLSL